MLVGNTNASRDVWTGLSLSTTGGHALRALLTRTYQCQSQRELVDGTIDKLADIFGANCTAVLLADCFGCTTHAAFRGVSERAYDAYETYWRPIDKVLAAVLEHQVPVHGAQIEGDDVRRASPIYLEYARPLDLFHYMSAPIYGIGGQLAGVFNVCRPEHHRVFGRAELDLAAVVAGHLSANLARLPANRVSDSPCQLVQLAPREREVALMAAQGFNNLEIAATLHLARETVKKTLRRVYLKLDVNGRAEMVARLAEHDLL
jgi:DNA-binding CsgD family transcriptional regulator